MNEQKTERIGLFPGSFDPMTKGHLDLLRRSAKLVDKIYVAVLINQSKKSLFSDEERVKIIQLAARDIPGVEVILFKGMTVELCRSLGVSVMFRGLRGTADFDYEQTIAQINQKLEPEVESVFLMTDPALSFVSSSAVREVASYGGDLSPYLPAEIIPIVEAKFAAQKAL